MLLLYQKVFFCVNFLYELTITILKNSPPFKRIQLLKKQTGYPESGVHKRRFPFEYILEKGNVP